MPEENEKKNSLPTDVEDNLRKLRFQLYVPHTEELKKFSEERTDPEEIVDEVAAKHKLLLRSMNGKFMDPALDTDNMAPRKGHWEMKKVLAGKTERLQKRTRRALLELARAKQEDGAKIAMGTEEHVASSDED